MHFHKILFAIIAFSTATIAKGSTSTTQKENTLSISASSDWKLTELEAIDQATHAAMQAIINGHLQSTPHPSSEFFEEHLYIHLKNEGINIDRSIDTRERAYGTQYLCNVEVSVTKHSLERFTAEWERLEALHNKRIAIACLFAPCLLLVFAGLTIKADRSTLGDRRFMLSVVALILVVAIGFSGYFMALFLL